MFEGNAIEINSLTRFFGQDIAVDNISFSIAKGEIFGLVGPNGAGKTTTIKMLTTLLPPTSGTASVFGYDIRRQPQYVRSFIGYVPQALSTEADLTGYENLLVFAKLWGVPRAERRRQIAEILEMMDLTESADKRVRYYSGGMVRRLEIGQAMLTQPSVLFLDEPTVGLDPVARRTVWDLLTSLREKYPISILLTTHYLEEAEAMCGRIAIMNHGKLAALGTSDELKSSTGMEDATLEDAFRAFTQEDYDERGNYRELRRTRRIAKRLG